jgi:hypothetical protein
MEKINRICETKENWDPDCENLKVPKHFIKTKTEQCHGKTNKDFIEKLRKGQTEFFDSDSFSSKLEFLLKFKLGKKNN